MTHETEIKILQGILNKLIIPSLVGEAAINLKELIELKENRLKFCQACNKELTDADRSLFTELDFNRVCKDHRNVVGCYNLQMGLVKYYPHLADPDLKKHLREFKL